jgi:hypothetical protein
MTVRLQIDDVDRPKLGHPNVFGVVMEENDGFYSIVTKSGLLPQKFTRNQFVPCENQFLSVVDVPEKETSLRKAVGDDSTTGTQGKII